MDKSIEPSSKPIIKKVNALPWEKQPDYLIYNYKGKKFVYYVPRSSKPVTDEDIIRGLLHQ